MRKIDDFTNLYSVSKTLRFKAIPVGKTQENIEKKRIVEDDAKRAEDYKAAKKIIDKYHKTFIERVLKDITLSGLEEYVEIYNKKEKDDADKKSLKTMEEKLRKQISGSFSKDKEFESLFNKTLVEEILPNALEDEEEKNIISKFCGFKTAFEGFNQNRKNMYSDEEKSTAIAYRCINENLPRFISNRNCFDKIKNALGSDTFDTLTDELNLDPYTAEDIFSVDFFDYVLANSGIEFYNKVLGGLTDEKKGKIKGLNEFINLYNQQLSKGNKADRLPLLKPLYKQVLSDYNSVSFYSEGYKNVQDLLKDLYSVAGKDSSVTKAISEIELLFENINQFNPTGLFLKNGIPISDISNSITGDWNVIHRNWDKKYDSENMKKVPKDIEKYEEKRRKAFNAIDSFSLESVSELLSTEDKQYSIDDLAGYYNITVKEQASAVRVSYTKMEKLFEEKNKERFSAEDINRIKNYLDSVKEIEKTIKPFLGSKKEPDRDELFYGRFLGLYDDLSEVDSLYNHVRDFVVKKPYSEDKYKLYFQNPQFLGGWDRNKVADYRATMMRKGGLYYLVVIDKDNSKVLEKLEFDESEDYYEVLDYKLIPGASKQLPHTFFSGKGVANYKPSADVLEAYEKKTFIKGNASFSKSDCHKVIDYYKSAISQHEWNDIYNFRFSNTDSYEDISGFFKEVDAQGYKLSFYRLSSRQIDDLVENGKIYLFQIYNKDFSPYSHGTENLHTMLFKQLFNSDNKGSIKLCGGAELFFRKASIKKEDRIIHPANQEIKNKNPLNKKENSVFKYDVIKDKRYTVDQYEIHIPITLNRTPSDLRRINESVRRKLKEDENPYVIGIDRGERNLLYVCVIDGKGNIVEQHSFNEIISEYKDTSVRTNYHDLLSRREAERDKARQDWKSIENIKELKEGYISQVIHKICEYILKYDAVIAMEDLNSGFKNSRKKVEKQVYQKFEKALIDKLNYLSDKSIEIGKNGSVTRGYQLAEPFQSFKTMGTQNGFIFYIPAWLTSKIDPVTGFVDLLKPKYTSIAEAKAFIRQFDGITYNQNEDMFEFLVDYRKFPRTEADYRKEWKLYSNGKRIKTFRNPSKNSEWDSEEVELTKEFKNLFEKYHISYTDGDLREALCLQEDKQFYVDFIGLLKLILQMRNSITGKTDVDYLISPVKGTDGTFYISGTNEKLPMDADANGAYNIARKALWAIEQFKESDMDNISKTKIAISNKAWLEYAQKKGE